MSEKINPFANAKALAEKKHKIVVVRMRGEIGTRRETIDTFKMLGLKKMYSVTILDNTPSVLGMVKKVDNFAAWGEATEETQQLLGDKKNLKSPKGGFRSKKQRYPRGNLGYCGTAINEMIKRMI